MGYSAAGEPTQNACKTKVSNVLHRERGGAGRACGSPTLNRRWVERDVLNIRARFRMVPQQARAVPKEDFGGIS
jgi:hypothetical protein